MAVLRGEILGWNSGHERSISMWKCVHSAPQLALNYTVQRVTRIRKIPTIQPACEERRLAPTVFSRPCLTADHLA